MNRLLKKNLIYILFLFVFFNLLKAQPKEKSSSLPTGLIAIEKNLLPSDSGVVCYLSYRIAYNNLVFVKNGKGFNAGVTLNFDIKRNDKIIERKTSSQSIIISSYDSTNSDKDFLQGFISFPCNLRKYVVNSYLTISNSDRNFELDSILVDASTIIKKNVFPPIIVEKNESSCDSHYLFELVNYHNTIPFSLNDYQVIIPIKDTTVKQISVRIEQAKKEIINQNITNNINNDLVIKECNSRIVVDTSGHSSKIKYFILSGFSTKLNENPAKIFIDANGKALTDFEFSVIWNDKPRVLYNPELAIQLLSVIENDEKVDTLLSGDKKDYYKVLTDYWNSKKGNKSIAFNELEYEFYKRADYAAAHFGSLNNKNGAKTDRGKTYIQYGKPDEVKREYTESNYVTEVWIYNRLSKEFVFTDKTGLGNYTLEK